VRYQWVDENQEMADLPQTVIDAVNRFEEWQEKKDPRHPGWVEEVLEMGAGEDGVPMKRHDALIALSSHFLNFMDKPQEIVTLLRLWNTRNRPPYPNDKVEAQFYDIYSRWQRGEYGQKQKTIDVSSSAKLVDDFLAHLNNKGKSDKPEIGSGCDELDWYTWGLQRKQIYVLGAPTGTGKTSFLVPIAHAVLSQGKRVLYFPTELANEEPMEKLVSLGAAVAFEAVKKNSFNAEEHRRLVTFLQWIKDEGNLRMCGVSRPTKDTFRAAIDEHEPDVVILDHISHTGGSSENRYHNLQELVLSLKDIVKSYDCNLFTASQVKRPIRDLNTNTFYPSTLYDFYGCADIENEASIAILMQKGGDNTGKLVVAKNRILPREGTFELDFDPITTCYKLGA
jgi:archaellum biogenesis ATPase FlaH